MKIYELEREILIDKIPSVYDPNEKIFLTTLAYIDIPTTLPKEFPTIYTSEELKAQFILFLRDRDIEIEDNNFHIWKPFEVETITLSKGSVYEILPCCPQDISTSILLVFRKDCVITHIYVGLCSDLRNTIKNKTLNSWLGEESSKMDLYIPLNKFKKHNRRCADCEIRKAMIQIEQTVNAIDMAKLIVQLPLFGYENFIAKVASDFSGYVALCGVLKEYYTSLPKAQLQHLTDDIDSARIIITGGDFMENWIKNFERDPGVKVEKPTVEWSPLPTLTHLNLLFDFFKPKRIYSIPYLYAKLEQPVQMIGVQSDPIDKSTRKIIFRKSAMEDSCCWENFQELKTSLSVSKDSSKQNYKVPSIRADIKKEPPSISLDATVNCRNATVIEKHTSQDQGCTELQSHENSKNETISCDESSTKQSPNTQQISKQGLKRKISPSKDTLVYRRGKKGIHFVDEDSSSSE